MDETTQILSTGKGLPADSEAYFPAAESKGGWRWLGDVDDVRKLARMDAEALDAAFLEQQHFYSDSSSIVIIRNGYLVRESYSFNVLVPTRFDIWSGTKSFTSTAWGLLLDDSARGQLSTRKSVDLDTTAYQFIPEGFPLTDPRKERITIRHLLTMTSGIPGAGMHVVGIPTATGTGPFEHSLGFAPNRFGKWVNRLAAEPGTRWDYSDPAIAHLALAFFHLAGQEMSSYLKERVFDPIGIENLSWDVQGDTGAIGYHTNAHTGVHITARDLARFGYLMLRNGQWNGRQLVPAAWIELATRSSQDLNPYYGYLWWVNTNAAYWHGIPADTFVLNGYNSNRCYVIPSLDLVVVRIGSGPAYWNEQGLINRVVQAVL
jgi:CubicO group peptidase (beta-lactamase class C family)